LLASLRYSLVHPASYMLDLGQRMCPGFGGEGGCEDEVSFWAVCEPVLVPQTLKTLSQIRCVFDPVDVN
jgi:hypothetical protein